MPQRLSRPLTQDGAAALLWNVPQETEGLHDSLLLWKRYVSNVSLDVTAEIFFCHVEICEIIYAGFKTVLWIRNICY